MPSCTQVVFITRQIHQKPNLKKSRSRETDLQLKPWRADVKSLLPVLSDFRLYFLRLEAGVLNLQ